MARAPKGAAAPAVSVCIASYNCERHLAAAIASALAQTLSDIEVIVVDDGSTDGSVEIARRIARQDPRVVVDILPENRGPGGARNRGIELARGRWFAVLDSDDLYHPERLERLVAGAEADGADAAADDLMLFVEGGPARDRRRFLAGARRAEPSWITPAGYFDETRMFEGRANLGFLKPVISLAFLKATGLRYDAAMRIGEDDDLIVRLLKAGLKYRLYPEIRYFYRKHEQSISHRIGGGNLDQMIERAALMRRDWAGEPLAATAALARREASFLRAKAFVDMVEALKARRPIALIGAALRRPGALKHFSMPIGARLERIFRRGSAASGTSGRPAVAVISRQRVIGRTNGSSTYLLSLVSAIEAAGLEPHLISPSPHMFGRWPVLKLKAEMGVFRSIAVRGGVRVGDLIISTQPHRYIGAARAALGVLLGKLRLPSAWIAGVKAPYSIGADWTDADRLFVARHAPAGMVAAIADYIFLTEAFPFLVSPDAATGVIMHDLFHARAENLEANRAVDGVAVISEAYERSLLDKAQAVIAIQGTEAAYVRSALPKTRVIVAPMAAEPAPAIQPGRDLEALFVGSSTHPNVVGLEWLFKEVWPAVKAKIPAARLTVAGNVNRAFPQAPEGVVFLGVAPDLKPLYREAGVVISPLIIGSGLKIKLVEALAEGKAVVATTVTLQGVEAEAGPGVLRADDPAEFAKGMIDLLNDRTAREALAERGLAAARRHFGPSAAYADFTAWLKSRAGNLIGTGSSGAA